MEDHGATILVIRAQPIVVPRLTRDGNLWTVDLRPRSPLPEHALAAPVVESEEGGRVRYPVVGAGRMLWTTDPDAGDRLVLLPVRGAGMGLTLPYRFPQFLSLASQQGIVLQPLTADIEVATVPSGVLVRDRNGLLVSSPEDRRSAPRATDPVLDSPGLFDLEVWRRGGIEKFQENRQALTRATTGAGGAGSRYEAWSAQNACQVASSEMTSKKYSSAQGEGGTPDCVPSSRTSNGSGTPADAPQLRASAVGSSPGVG